MDAMKMKCASQAWEDLLIAGSESSNEVQEDGEQSRKLE